MIRREKKDFHILNQNIWINKDIQESYETKDTPTTLNHFITMYFCYVRVCMNTCVDTGINIKAGAVIPVILSSSAKVSW